MFEPLDDCILLVLDEIVVEARLFRLAPKEGVFLGVKNRVRHHFVKLHVNFRAENEPDEAVGELGVVHGAHDLV